MTAHDLITLADLREVLVKLAMVPVAVLAAIALVKFLEAWHGGAFADDDK